MFILFMILFVYLSGVLFSLALAKYIEYKDPAVYMTHDFDFSFCCFLSYIGLIIIGFIILKEADWDPLFDKIPFLKEKDHE